MENLNFKVCRTGKWFFVPKLRRNCGNETVYQTSLFILCYEFVLRRKRKLLVQGEASRKYVTAGGYILCTESDERDKVYVINRSRGFEMTYGKYEIVLKNGAVHVYSSDDDEIERDNFESQMVNVSDSSI